MATIRSSIELYNSMTPTLQSITNALNITISHFEQMQRVSGNSIDNASFLASIHVRCIVFALSYS